MTFAFNNPGFLYLLPITALPVVLHLILKSRRNNITFGTVKYIRLAYEKRIKGFRLRQILLLIARILLILFLILSFARPVLKKGGSGISTEYNNSVVIIADNSFSMNYREGKYDNFADVKKKVLDICSVLKPGDTAALITAEDADSFVSGSLTYNIESVKGDAENMELYNGKLDISGSIKRAEKLLDDSINPVKVIYIILT